MSHAGPAVNNRTTHRPTSHKTCLTANDSVNRWTAREMVTHRLPGRLGWPEAG